MALYHAGHTRCVGEEDGSETVRPLRKTRALDNGGLTDTCSQHLEAVKPKFESGLITMGGATLDEPLKDGQAMKINGSAMIVEADSEEEVRKIIESDIYYTSGVWDAKKVRCGLIGGRGVEDLLTW